MGAAVASAAGLASGCALARLATDAHFHLFYSSSAPGPPTSGSVACWKRLNGLSSACRRSRRVYLVVITRLS
jgi:hypothetical protein